MPGASHEDGDIRHSVLALEVQVRRDLEDIGDQIPDDHRIFVGHVAGGMTWFDAARATWPELSDLQAAARADAVQGHRKTRQYLSLLRGRTLLSVADTARRAFMRLEMTATSEGVSPEVRVRADGMILRFATTAYEQLARAVDGKKPSARTKGITGDELGRLAGYLTGQVIDTEATE